MEQMTPEIPKLVVVRFLLRTFSDWEEPDQNQRIVVCPANIVVNIPNRQINRIIFMLTSGNRDCRFVRTEYDQDEHTPMHSWVHHNDILRKW